jgi:serine/threonine protein kinase
MGRVLARQQMLDRLVALKPLLPEYAGNSDFRSRFLRESRLAASLELPSIVPLYHAVATREAPLTGRPSSS